ncbi:MAG: AEC family transporter [Spirochaetaceae bacterium]
MSTVLAAVARLVLLAALGYLMFRPEFMRKHVLTPLVFTTINILFPFYFIANFGENWDSAAAVGPTWLIGAALLCGVMMGVQGMYMRRLVGRRFGIPTDHPAEVATLGALHNAGYIPIPIMQALFGGPVMIYLFFYTLGFNLIFWTIAVALVRGGPKQFVFRLNAPTAGLVLGILLAATGWYDLIPGLLRRVMSLAGSISLDLVLVGLGGVLARISTQAGVDRTDWSRYVVYRSFAYPAAVLLFLWVIPLGGIPSAVAVALPVGIVLQASSPPATNLMLVAEAYGTHEQVEVFGRGVIVSYLASAVAIPVFVTLGFLAFS